LFVKMQCARRTSARRGKHVDNPRVNGDPNILDPHVREALDRAGVQYDVVACAPELADTADFCAHYDIPPANACNTIVIVAKTTPKRYAACLVAADTKLDVNHKVSALMGTKKLSFASADETAELTGMLIGGVTLPGLPSELPIWIDNRVLKLDYAILGGGNRSSKIKVAPAELTKLPNAQFADIANPR
jgi:prolyl-tRNA editing enzyme YbaK/EbsC (Cys-tRNA(Pro) deacylase)